MGRDLEDLLRRLAPQVLATLVRRYGGFDECEDAVQEALLAAATSWPDAGLPDNPRGWLVAVASRRLIDGIRNETARRRREERVFDAEPAAEVVAEDDTLVLLLLCCHPTLTTPSQIALTLRAVGGLTTAEIAAAFFVPEATMGQRISRAKQRVRDAGETFALPPAAELDERLRAVMHVLYLIFNEGYTTTAGDDLHRPELSAEAIRLTRELLRLRPDDTEVAGLLALMLLTDARRAARTSATGELIALADQDRSIWDSALIAEGVDLITDALHRAPLGAYQLQAAIAAVHDEAPTADDTDWLEILGLYDLLERVAPNPMVRLNRAVALANVLGPDAALEVLAELAADERVAGHHRLYAVRAHVRQLAGDANGAYEDFREAAARTLSIPERRWLERRAAAVKSG